MRFRHLPTTSNEDVTANFEQLQTIIPPLAASLPATATDGQEVYYLADATNGVVWYLRYRAASVSTHKWEFIGGAPMVAEVTTEQATESLTFADLATVGPSVTVPLAGDYEVTYGAKVIIGASPVYGLVGLKVGAEATTHTIAAGKAAESVTSVFRRYRAEGVAASALLKLQYESGEVHPSKYAERVLSVLPVRVG